MSWEEEFYLPRPASTYEGAALVAVLRRIVPDDIEVVATRDNEITAVRLRFAIARTEEIAACLGSSRGSWLAFEWRADVDPPLDPDRTYYDLVVELVDDDDRHLLRVASSDGDNRAAWPLAFAVAGCLADALDATADPPPDPPDERDLN